MSICFFVCKLLEFFYEIIFDLSSDERGNNNCRSILIFLYGAIF